MAKSLFDTYQDGTMEVTHNGEDALFELPEWMKEVGEIIENEEELILWMKKHNITLAIIHAGLAKIKIDFCAIVRPADIPGEKKGEKIKVSLIQDADKAQIRADKFTIKPATRIGTGGKSPEDRAAAALKLLNSLPKEVREATLAKANTNR